MSEMLLLENKRIYLINLMGRSHQELIIYLHGEMEMKRERDGEREAVKMTPTSGGQQWHFGGAKHR